MKRTIRYILLFVFVIGMILGIILFFSWINDHKQTEKIIEKETIRIKIEEDNTYLDPEILKDNPDTIGWISVEGTNINYPVVQYTDNKYYLNHDFNKQYNSAGWIFMDYKNNLEDQNLVIYGHHRHDQIMFGSIDELYNQNKKDLEITLITTNEKRTYKIFSIYKINKEDYYTNKKFDNLEETIKEFQKRSLVDFNQEIENPTQIITLSTCHNNNIDRIVVHGYKK